MKCRVNIFRSHEHNIDAGGVDFLVAKVWENEADKPAEINVIMVNDSELLELNKQYLKHDTLTDVIAFPLSDATDAKFEAEIYVSIDRVMENSSRYGVTPEEELKRTVTHGILHFLGYRDKHPEDKKRMSARENYYLDVYGRE